MYKNKVPLHSLFGDFKPKPYHNNEYMIPITFTNVKCENEDLMISPPYTI